MPSVEIVAVGTELLLGQLLDTNTAYVAECMAACGIDVYGTRAVGDNRTRIAAAIAAALEHADGVVTTGGLGPTVDDLTKESVCDALDLGTELHEPSLRAIEALFEQLRRPMRENNRKQAMLPRGAYILENPNGTAAGFVVSRADGKFVACMPGVPHEMKPMLADRLLPWLRERFGMRDAIHTFVLHTINISESEIDHRIDDLFRALENPKIAVLAHTGRCDVKIMAKAPSRAAAEALIEPVRRELGERLAGHVYGTGEKTLAGAVHGLLQARGQRLAVAESCTGGRICAALTAVPGSSASFAGGVVAYEDSVKAAVLGVDVRNIERHGAVSVEVAAEMALGVRRCLGADLGLASTGIAGPGGAAPGKPVGLVFVGVALADGPARTFRIDVRGQREVVQDRATTFALGVLWKQLRDREQNASPLT